MSIQAGWNSALGIIGGLGYLKELRKGQEQIHDAQVRTLKKYENPELDIHEQIGYEDVAGVRKAMEEEGIKVGSGTKDEKAFDKQLDDLTAQKVAKSTSVYDEYPEEARKMAKAEHMGMYEGALKGVSPKELAIKKEMQSWADNPVAVNLYNAPKNTMQGAMDAIKNINENRNKVMFGGDK